MDMRCVFGERPLNQPGAGELVHMGRAHCVGHSLDQECSNSPPGRRVGQRVHLAHLLCALLLACCFAARETFCARDQWGPAVCRYLRVPCCVRHLCCCACVLNPWLCRPKYQTILVLRCVVVAVSMLTQFVGGGVGGGVGSWLCPRPRLLAQSCSGRRSRRSANHQATWGTHVPVLVCGCVAVDALSIT